MAEADGETAYKTFVGGISWNMTDEGLMDGACNPDLCAAAAAVGATTSCMLPGAQLVEAAMFVFMGTVELMLSLWDNRVCKSSHGWWGGRGRGLSHPCHSAQQPLPFLNPWHHRDFDSLNQNASWWSLSKARGARG
jgi:hypothetical protein